ncbi:hypothetical protein OAA06_02330, partial [bacterium]|nr:hypothetical protein [bacterium]
MSQSLLAILLFLSFLQVHAQNKLTWHVTNLPSGQVIIGSVYGDKFKAIDTIAVNDGSISFSFSDQKPN